MKNIKITRKLNILHMIKTNQTFDYKNKILNGTMLSQVIQSSIIEKLSLFKNELTDFNNFSKNAEIPPPKLKVILVGDRMDSKVYVENKLKLCKSIGMEGELKHFSSNANKEEILEEIDSSNKDTTVHGIIVQLPLPEKLANSRTEILSHVELSKDVDGLNPLNQGKILQMNLADCLIPPTAMGVLELLRLAIDYSNDIEDYKENYLKSHIFNDQPINLAGLDVTVIGRGLTAGLPLSILMQKCNATVTLCHSKTKHLKSKCETSDIVISAVGKTNLIGGEDIKDQSIIVDVGINVEFDENGNKLITGDVDFTSSLNKVKYITPVPGGVGKMTVIMLLKNVIKAWSVLNKINLK